MRKLILSSNGIANQDIYDAFVSQLAHPLNKVKLLYIPLALQETFSPQCLIAALSTVQNLTELGIAQENIHWLDEANLHEDYDAIYVSGGNTFYLMDQINRRNLREPLTRMVDSGAVWFGVSAGSIIACPDITIASPFDDNRTVRLKSMKGLGFHNEVITPHFQYKDPNVIEALAHQIPYRVQRVCDGQAYVVVNGKPKLIGIAEKPMPMSM